MATTPITTAARVGNYLGEDVSALDDVLDAALDQAVADASSIVLNAIFRPDLTGLADELAEAVTVVATKVAARMWKNPGERASYSYDEVSQTYTDPRTLTADERRLLARAVDTVRGPIIITGPGLP